METAKEDIVGTISIATVEGHSTDGEKAPAACELFPDGFEPTSPSVPFALPRPRHSMLECALLFRADEQEVL
jgi:hypothetical protein